MNTGSAPAGAHPSRFAFFENLAGEGTAAERAAVEAHAAACPECAAALPDAVAERDGFAARHPLRRHLAALRRFPSGGEGELSPNGAAARFSGLLPTVAT